MAAGQKESSDKTKLIRIESQDLEQYSLPEVRKQYERRETRAEPGKLFRALGMATYGVSAGDAITTEIVLARDGVELNPFQRNRAVRIGSHVALPFVSNASSEFIRKKGFPKAALWFRIATVAFYGYLTARNIHVARGLK